MNAAAGAAMSSAAPPIPGASHTLAMGLLRNASARWRGDSGAAVLPLRLSAYWQPELRPAPLAEPDAFSPHGAAGRGIRWYQMGQEVLGYIPGVRGGFRIPVHAVPRLARCAP